jgi:hypothetical protein
MASFLNLWPHRPSETSEGFRMFGIRLVSAALVVAAHAIASALSELATQGSHAMRTQSKFLTGALSAPACSASLVRAPALVRGGGSRV